MDTGVRCPQVFCSLIARIADGMTCSAPAPAQGKTFLPNRHAWGSQSLTLSAGDQSYKEQRDVLKTCFSCSTYRGDKFWEAKN